MLNTQQYPYATLTLTSPIAFANIPGAGEDVAGEAAGTVTIHGTSHPVTFALTGRYEGTLLTATGTAPILASDWGVQSPFGIHDNDIIEFLVILRQS
jgi:polyisoprenoid-binding protein YceI